MKVQIEIPKKMVNLAIAQISLCAKDENDMKEIDRAVDRCEKEVTNLDLDKLDDNMEIRTLLAFIAITQQGERIRQEEGKE